MGDRSAGGAHGINAAAIILIIQSQLFYQSEAGFLHAVFAAFYFQIRNAGLFGSAGGGGVNLRQIFPARNAQNRSNGSETVSFGVFHHFFQAQLKTDGAAGAAFGFVFVGQGGLEPIFGVVGEFRERNVPGCAELLLFIAALFIFGGGVNVRVVKRHGEIRAVFMKLFDDGAGTRRTTGKEEQPPCRRCGGKGRGR